MTFGRVSGEEVDGMWAGAYVEVLGVDYVVLGLVEVFLCDEYTLWFALAIF